MTDWMAHVDISAVIHGLIYGLIFKVMGRLTRLKDGRPRHSRDG